MEQVRGFKRNDTVHLKRESHQIFSSRTRVDLGAERTAIVDKQLWQTTCQSGETKEILFIEATGKLGGTVTNKMSAEGNWEFVM